jgi:2',3'-cyclic-nucleotide 2'-phosphodiesterase / 3'-nucleotidase
MRMYRARTARVRVVAAVAAGTLIASTAAAAAATDFEDVDDGSVHAEAIAELSARGVVEGRTATTYAPFATVTRAQLASMVVRAGGLTPSDARPFPDVRSGPHVGAIAAAEEAGLVEGYADGTFRPNQPIQRAQIAAVLHRWLTPPPGDADAFSDLHTTIHAEAIASLAGIDVARGTTAGTFRPTAPLQRDQAASFLHRALRWLESAPASADLTVLGTSDLHNHALDWDYYGNAQFRDRNVGLARVGTLIEQIREERGEDHVLLLDNGDTFQGNPLGSYYASSEHRRITDQTEFPHPMALGMNALGFDAMVAGNHEFNYGLDFLDAVEDQVDFPVLGANVRDADDDGEYLEPYTMIDVEVEDAEPIQVGVLGLTTPGSAVWDRSHVEGIVEFTGGVETAEAYVPEMLDGGADVIVVIAHAGISGGSSYGDAIPLDENFVAELAETVPGIDAIIAGHSHRDVPEQLITNAVTGDDVVVTQPGAWGRFLSVIDIELVEGEDGWNVAEIGSETRSTANVPESPTVVDLVTEAHEATVAYVNSTVGTSTEELSMARANLEDVAGLDLINRVQEDATRDFIEGTEWEDLPVLSLAAPFNLNARLPEGDVSVRDIAGLYIYDNTLVAVEMTGAELADYLEWSAEYFTQVTEPGTNPTIGFEKPSYNYDVLSGVTYDLDIAQPVGERVVDLEFEGAAIDPEQRFVVATNNYRANGGGGAPHIDDAPIVWDSLLENRQLIIDWVIDRNTVDPAEFHTVDWQLLNDGQVITFTD